MIKKGKQISKRQKELTARFQYAYERLSYNHKKMACDHFCEDFGIVSGTFGNKVSGTNPVAETEVEWIERVASNPIKELRQPESALS